MKPSTKAILADNVRKILQRDDANPTSWTKSAAQKKAVQRILAGHNAELETIEEIAELAGLQPWQLLFPDLDVANPPVFALTEEERKLCEALGALANRLARAETSKNKLPNDSPTHAVPGETSGDRGSIQRGSASSRNRIALLRGRKR